MIKVRIRVRKEKRKDGAYVVGIRLIGYKIITLNSYIGLIITLSQVPLPDPFLQIPDRRLIPS